MKKEIAKQIIYKCIILCLFTQNIFSQKSINVIQSNQLDQIVINDTIFHKFSGNVIIEYSDLNIICDTILINQHKDLMLGWGNTSISNDTILCITDSIKMKERAKHIMFYNNSSITINDMTIYSNLIQYDYKNYTLAYVMGGHIKTQDHKIESDQFSYDLKQKTSQFYNNVNIETNKQYNIETQEMNYTQEVMTFSGDTYIQYSEFDIVCTQGVFKPAYFLKLSKGVILNFDDKKITSNIFERDLTNNKNYFKQNVNIQFDSQTSATGHNLFQFNNVSTITDNAQIQLNNVNNSIVIKGDMIKINELQDELEIVNNIIIKGDELNGKCNNVKFTSDYTTIEMSQDPTLWLRDTQITGEKIILYRNNQQLDSIYIPEKPFIISPNDSSQYYNQIKGKLLKGRFKNDILEYIEVNGNSQMKYFDISSKNDSTVKINNVEAGKIQLEFENNNIRKILCFDQIESNQTEINMYKNIKNQEELLYLKGFKLKN